MAVETGIFLQLRLRGGMRIGPGKAELLEQIDASGSISAAARRMSMSYKRAWDLVASLNSAFEKKVVLTRVGGRPDRGAELTSFGRSLLKQYRELEVETRAEAQVFLAWLEGQTAGDVKKTT